MTAYSHSRIGTFLQCRQKYKFQYIDKIKYLKDEEFTKLLKDKGLWDQVITLNVVKLRSMMLKRKVDTEISERINTEQGWIVKLIKR